MIASTNQAHAIRVLLVEDNPGDARLLERRLGNSTYVLLDAEVEIVWADCLTAAMDALRDGKFDAILVDLGLPESQGVATLERLSEYVQEVPVIVLTGLDDPEMAVRAVRAGAQDYLHKDNLDGDQIARILRYSLERQRAQRDLYTRMTEIDRFVTMGQVAAGIAHEINNPLAFISSNVEYALKILQDSRGRAGLSEPLATYAPEVVDALEDAIEGGRRVRDVVRDLRRLAGGDPDLGSVSMEPVSVQRPLESSINIASKHIVDRAKLIEEIEPVPHVIGNESKLGQVFLNVLMNAAQAIPTGDIKHNEVRVRTYTRRHRVVVEISDSGRGIRQENLDKIFKPFFTTKRSGEGTGLGLAISKQIISSLGGELEVDSTVGEGTTVRVVLVDSQMLYDLPTEAEEI